jgi:hypothetical protein
LPMPFTFPRKRLVIARLVVIVYPTSPRYRWQPSQRRPKMKHCGRGKPVQSSSGHKVSG